MYIYTHTYIHTSRQADRQTDRHTDIQTYRHTGIQAYRHTDIQTYIHTYGYKQFTQCVYIYPHIWPLEDALKPDHFPRDILGGEQVTMPSNQSLTRNLDVFSH